MADMKKISEQGLLDVLADFDEQGGASLGLAAWELFLSEQDVSETWAAAIASAGWSPPGGTTSSRAAVAADRRRMGGSDREPPGRPTSSGRPPSQRG